MPDIIFVSLGMFIIDTIIDVDGHQLDNVIGGAGTYAAIGSRLFTQPGETGFIVDYGNDTPPAIESTLSSLGLALEVRRDQTRQCTRGLNTYRGNLRLFEYLTPKIRITPAQLSSAMIAAKSFHLICTPQRCIDIVKELSELRVTLSVFEDPWIIWEPVPDSCTPENLEDFKKAVTMVDIVSPNMEESMALLSEREPTSDIDKQRLVQDMARDLAAMMVKNATVVIRCSAMGAYIHSEQLKAWFPAFITEAAKVVDATGAGNTFCGAFVTRLAQSSSKEEAMICASIAAGLSIMQVGLPVLTNEMENMHANYALLYDKHSSAG